MQVKIIKNFSLLRPVYQGESADIQPLKASCIGSYKKGEVVDLIEEWANTLVKAGFAKSINTPLGKKPSGIDFLRRLLGGF